MYVTSSPSSSHKAKDNKKTMSFKHTYLSQVERFATHLLENHLPKGLCYHNYRHTIEVVEAAFEIGLHMNLADDDLECIQIAAWLHDIGHSLTYQQHEAAAHHLALALLKAIDYPQTKTEKVLGCIAATRMPQQPEHLLQQIICDADLAHLSKANFFDRNALLRQEWYTLLGKSYTDEDWEKETYSFLHSHKYFTPYAQAHWEKRKRIHFDQQFSPIHLIKSK